MTGRPLCVCQADEAQKGLAVTGVMRKNMMWLCAETWGGGSKKERKKEDDFHVLMCSGWE